MEADAFYRYMPQAAAWRRGDLQLGSILVAAREGQLALRNGRLALADSAISSVLEALERWRSRSINENLTASLAQLSMNWGGLDELYPDIVDHLVRRNRVAAAFDLVERVRGREVVERRLRAAAVVPDSVAAVKLLRSGRSDPVIGLPTLRSALTRDEAIVTFVLGVDDAPTTALVITRDTVIAHRLPGRNALLPSIRRFVQLAAAGTEAIAVSRELGDALLAPVLATLPAGIVRIIVSPDGELHRVPFDALRLPDGRRALERASFSTVPSATALIALRSTPGRASDRVVAVGDPRYPAPSSRPAERGANDVTAFAQASLPRLRYSGDEARRVARYGVRSTVLSGAAATEPAVSRALASGAGVLHIAAHGLVDDASQYTTAIALAPGDGEDGFLTPADIARIDLSGTIVVLSACRSSAGLVLGGEGLRGLTGPLLEAGSRAVVGTHWAIADRSVVPFIDRFYGAVAAGARLDDALRQTKLAAIRAGVSIAEWGAYTVTGDAAARPILRLPGGAPPPWVRSGPSARRDSSSR
jgi:CHAT domain-containing protein